MDISESQYSKILRFMEGSMSMDEIESFEKELEADPALRKELDFAISLAEILPALPSTRQSEYAASDKGRLVPMTRWIGIAAVACLLLLVICNAIFTTQNTVTKDERTVVIAKPVNNPAPSKEDSLGMFKTLFKKYFRRDKVPSSYPIYLADAFDKYDKGNMLAFATIDIEAIAASRGNETGEETENAKSMLRYYKAQALLEQDRAKAAIPLLASIEENEKDPTRKEKAAWYLALAFLNAGDTQHCIQQLILLKSKKQYATRSVELLNALSTEGR